MLSKLCREFILFALVLAQDCPDSSAQAANPHPPDRPLVTLYVFNYSAVPERVIARAQEAATDVFKVGGTQLEWVSCPIKGSTGPEGCLQSPKTNQAYVRLLRRPGDSEMRFERGTVGTAIRIDEDTGSGYISLYCEPIEQLASTFGLARALMLGRVLAHEIGHLLLPPKSHSGSGIMRARSGRQEWEQAAKGGLLFTPEQQRELRAGILRRAEGAPAAMRPCPRASGVNF